MAKISDKVLIILSPVNGNRIIAQIQTNIRPVTIFILLCCKLLLVGTDFSKGYLNRIGFPGPKVSYLYRVPGLIFKQLMSQFIRVGNFTPLIAVTMSPALIPALAAAPFGITRAT